MLGIYNIVPVLQKCDILQNEQTSPVKFVGSFGTSMYVYSCNSHCTLGFQNFLVLYRIPFCKDRYGMVCDILWCVL